MLVDYSSIGARIKSFRKQKHITQEQLAEKLSVSVGYISQLERGITKINLETLAAVSEILGCDLCCLIQGTIAPQKEYLFSEINTVYKKMTSSQRKLLLSIAEQIVSSDMQ